MNPIDIAFVEAEMLSVAPFPLINVASSNYKFSANMVGQNGSILQPNNSMKLKTSWSASNLALKFPAKIGELK